MELIQRFTKAANKYVRRGCGIELIVQKLMMDVLVVPSTGLANDDLAKSHYAMALGSVMAGKTLVLQYYNKDCNAVYGDMNEKPEGVYLR